MQRLGKNKGGYFGETMDIGVVLRDITTTALTHGWNSDTFCETDGHQLLALHRKASTVRSSSLPSRVYISAGIHGDEPAGPLAALQLLRENVWPAHLDLWLCPCLNPAGFALNRRENARGHDLNRQYLHLEAEETRAHIAWLERQPGFNLAICLHEDWESHGFYLYELNPDGRPSLAEGIITAVRRVCPVDPSELIEGKPARGGIIQPSADPLSRAQWPEAFWLLQNRTRLSYTLEAPSDFPLATRVNALVAAVGAAVAGLPAA